MSPRWRGSHRDGVLIGVAVSGACCLLIALVVARIFAAHILGNLTFPWDFQGGYFSHAVARIRDGSFLAPPLWLPWGGFGLPGHMSLQDGAWYLPQYLYAALDGYDMVGATRLQVLHVALASLGMFALCRSFGLARIAALVAAFGYLFSGSFFSNAQHVDIVRGAALLPWLMFALHQLWRHGTAPWFLLYVLACWQLIIGAYPGIVVSAAYVSLALLLVLVGSKPEGRDIRLSRFLLAGIGALCAAAMASVKYLPALLDNTNIRHAVDPAALATPSVFTTLVFDYDVLFLPNDLTMRDLFLPTCLAYLAVIGLRRDRISAFGGLAILVALVFVTDLGGWQSLVAHLPGARISRFPLSDFRPVLHVGVCLLAAASITGFMRAEHAPLRELLVRSLVFFAMLGAVIWYGLALGHTPSAAYWALATSSLTALVCFAAAIGKLKPPLVHVAFLGVALIVLVHGREHIFDNARTWRVERSDALERNQYGDTLETLTARNRFDALEWRPPRLLFNKLPVQSKRELINDRYQAGWIGEGFAAFGYENYKFMPGLRRLYDAALSNADSTDRASMQWMLGRSAVIVMAVQSDVPADVLSACSQPVCAGPDVVDRRIAMQQFRENGAVYDVESIKPFFFVENEPMYAGWQALRCMGDRCVPAARATAVNGFLRGWSMEPGTYRLITYYRPPGWKVASVVAWTGVAVAILLALLLAYSGMPRRRVSSTAEASA